MKSRIFVFSLVLAMIAGVSFAQKVDREPLGYYSYTQLPIDVSLKAYKTYKVINKDDMDAYKKDKMVAAINLAGFGKKKLLKMQILLLRYRNIQLNLGILNVKHVLRPIKKMV